MKLPRVFTNQKGVIHLALIIAVIGVLVFIAVTQLAQFNTGIFQKLFSKVPSFADNQNVIFLDTSGQPITQTISATVSAKLTAPLPSAAATATPSPTPSPTLSPTVGFWKFDEGIGTTVKDSSGKNQNGTWSGTGTSHWTTGKFAKAGLFNGTNDKVVIPSSSTLTFPGNIVTVSAWVYISAYTGNGGIISKSDGGKYNLIFDGWGGNKFRMEVQSDKGYFNARSTTIPNLNTWYHVAGTWDGTSVKVYVNGKLETTTLGSGTIYQDSQSLYIGYHNNGGSSGYFKGRIDEVRAYSYAQTPQQILADMNPATPSSSPTPSSTPAPITVVSATVSEDPNFTTNVKTISPFTQNPAVISYTFSNTSLGIKTLYVKFKYSSGPDQTFFGTVELINYAPDQVLIKYKPGTSTTTRQQTISRTASASVIETIVDNSVDLVKVPGGQVQSSITTFKADPNVETAEPNYIVKTTAITNDPKLSEQWALTKINAAGSGQSAWDISTGLPSIKVAVIDTGIDTSHPDLGQSSSPYLFNDKVVGGFNYVEGNGYPYDDNGHGTHVAGIIGATGNNSLGIAGIAYNASLLSVKVMDKLGFGTTSNLIKGIRWAADNKAQVISLSLGCSGCETQTLEDAINYAWNKGVVIVAAAGNFSSIIKFYPAAYENVIAVSATDSNDQKAAFSNYGDWIDVSAPGVSILSTYKSDYWSCPNCYYRILSGTSMAAPHVAGLAALIWAKGACTTNSCVVNNIESTALDLGLPGRDDEFGWGRINALADYIQAPPYIPTGISATCNDQGNAVVSWNPAVRATSYTVTLKPPTKILVTQSTALNTTTLSITPNLLYDSSVRAINSYGESGLGYGNPISCLPPAPPDIPTGITSSCSAQGNSIIVNWNPSARATSYSVTLSSVGSIVDTKIQSTTQTTATFSVYQNVNYIPQVTAQNSAGVSQAASGGQTICPSSTQEVFVTSTTYNGSLGGIAGADNKCQTQANAVGLGGTWKAWISTSGSSAKDRLIHNTSPYVLVNGTKIADNWTDLTDQTIAAPIDKDEKGNTVSAVGNVGNVWTNTFYNGNYDVDVPAYNCSDWTSASGAVSNPGLTNATNIFWSYGAGYQDCSQLKHLYCFEQSPTPTGIPIPSVPADPTF